LPFAPASHLPSASTSPLSFRNGNQTIRENGAGGRQLFGHRRERSV